MTFTADEERLESLLKDLIRFSNDNSDRSTEVNAALAELADVLRDASLRPKASSSDLSDRLAKLLNEDDVQYAQQVGRVAANLAANCDEGRTLLVNSGYIDALLGTLRKTDLPPRELVASLLNLAIEGTECVTKALSGWDKLEVLLIKANAFSKQETETSNATAHWLWTVVETVIQEDTETLASSMQSQSLNHFAQPLNSFASGSNSGDDTKPLATLQVATDILDALSQQETFQKSICFAERSSLLSSVFGFLERASVPEQWKTGNSEDIPELEKQMGSSKASAVRFLVNVSEETKLEGPKGSELWATMRRWLRGVEREDLVACALLVFGNSVQKDEDAQRLVSGPESILADVLKFAKQKTSATTQHALVGFLRNVSISRSASTQLKEHHVVQLLMEMGVWGQDRDMLGSVQGGTISVIKNLCREDASTSSAIIAGENCDRLLELLDRSDDQAMKWEGSRLLVNVVKSTSQSAEGLGFSSNAKWDRIVKRLAETLRTGTKHTILINESVIALALVSTFGGEAAKSAVRPSLLREEASTGEDQMTSGLATLKAVLKPDGQGVTVPPEVAENCRSLVKMLSEGDSPEARQISSRVETAFIEEL